MSFSEDPERQPDGVVQAVRQAGDGWASAMRAHKLAPPDAGFAGRLDRLAKAAVAEQTAWQQAHRAGLHWRPVPGAETAAPPYELRPGTGRRGPEPLWDRFDSAVAALNQAIAGADAGAVAEAFGEMGRAASELAEAVAREDQAAASAAARGAA